MIPILSAIGDSIALRRPCRCVEKYDRLIETMQVHVLDRPKQFTVQNWLFITQDFCVIAGNSHGKEWAVYVTILWD